MQYANHSTPWVFLPLSPNIVNTAFGFSPKFTAFLPFRREMNALDFGVKMSKIHCHGGIN